MKHIISVTIVTFVLLLQERISLVSSVDDDLKEIETVPVPNVGDTKDGNIEGCRLICVEQANQSKDNKNVKSTGVKPTGRQNNKSKRKDKTRPLYKKGYEDGLHAGYEKAFENVDKPGNLPVSGAYQYPETSNEDDLIDSAHNSEIPVLDDDILSVAGSENVGRIKPPNVNARGISAGRGAVRGNGRTFINTDESHGGATDYEGDNTDGYVEDQWDNERAAVNHNTNKRIRGQNGAGGAVARGISVGNGWARGYGMASARNADSGMTGRNGGRNPIIYEEGLVSGRDVAIADTDRIRPERDAPYGGDASTGNRRFPPNRGSAAGAGGHGSVSGAGDIGDPQYGTGMQEGYGRGGATGGGIGSGDARKGMGEGNRRGVARGTVGSGGDRRGMGDGSRRGVVIAEGMGIGGAGTGMGVGYGRGVVISGVRNLGGAGTGMGEGYGRGVVVLGEGNSGGAGTGMGQGYGRGVVFLGEGNSGGARAGRGQGYGRGVVVLGEGNSGAAGMGMGEGHGFVSGQDIVIGQGYGASAGGRGKGRGNGYGAGVVVKRGTVNAHGIGYGNGRR